MNALISFIVPVYNTESTLQRCLDSILAQDYRPIEIIAVDDGSEDGSLQILEENAKCHKNIRIIKQKNKGPGPGGARNTGLKVASGAYISFVDSDDMIMPDFCSYLLPLAQRADIIVAGRSTYVDGVYTKSKRASEIFFETSIGAIKQMLLAQHNSHTAWGKLYKADVLNGVQFHEGVIFEDIYFSLDTYFAAKNIAFADKDLYQYILRKSNSILTSSVERQISHHVMAGEYVYEQLKKHSIFEDCLHEYKMFLARAIIRVNRVFNRNPEITPDFFRKYSSGLVDLIENLGGLELKSIYEEQRK